jgi:hypothetical protein
MSEVKEYVSLFRNQTQYSEWLKPDPDLRPEIKGLDGRVGAVMQWESVHPDKNKNVGKGEQEITGMTDNSIEVALRLIHPMPAQCTIRNQFDRISEHETLYICSFHAYAKFPVNLPSFLIGRHFIKKSQQKTLTTIKNILEKAHDV